MKPIVSIITISYNAEAEIKETIESVLSQEYNNVEYIIVDGASKDATVAIAKKTVKRYPSRNVKLISEPDKGLYDAMNKGIRMASGQWCAFMNCGDKYLSTNVLSEVFSQAKDGIKVLYGKTVYRYADGTTGYHNTANDITLNQIIHKYQPYTHQAVFYNIENKQDCIYDLRYKIGADYDVACRYYKKYGASVFHLVPIDVCEFKAFDGVSTSAENKVKSIKEYLVIKVRNRMRIIEIIKITIRLLRLILLPYKHN